MRTELGHMIQKQKRKPSILKKTDGCVAIVLILIKLPIQNVKVI
jgi:hypothetical protein